MIKKTTLSILVASILVTACAGNNIKQQENYIDEQQQTKKQETAASSEVVLSDFPVEAASIEPETTSTTTESVSESTQSIEGSQKPKQPLIKIVNFKFDKIELSEENVDLIKKHAEFLQNNPSYVLAVNGHSDYRGPEVYNEKLSLKRANSVASLLLSFGAPESQLIINSFGASKPVEDFDNWHENRRVELEYSELYMVSK